MALRDYCTRDYIFTNVIVLLFCLSKQHGTEPDRQAISKINTARLLVKLTNSGFDEEVLANLHGTKRSYFILYAQSIADGKESTKKLILRLMYPY